MLIFKKKLSLICVVIFITTAFINANVGLYVSKNYCYTGGAVTVNYYNLPKNQKNFVALVPLGSTNNIFDKELSGYTNGNSDGNMTFYPKYSGEYEARLYCNCQNGRFNIAKKDRVSVMNPNDPYIESEYVSKERINLSHSWYPEPITVNGTTYYGFQKNLNNTQISIDNSKGKFLTIDSPQMSKSEAHGFIIIKGHSYLDFDDKYNHLHFIVDSYDSGGSYFSNYIIFENGEFEIPVFLNDGQREYKIRVFAYSLRNYTSSESIELATFYVVNTANNKLDNQNYLHSTSDCNAVDRVVQDKVKDITRGLSNDGDKAKAIFDYLTGILQYDHQHLEVNNIIRFTSSNHILTRRKGICAGQANLTATFIRAAGIHAVY